MDEEGDGKTPELGAEENPLASGAKAGQVPGECNEQWDEIKSVGYQEMFELYKSQGLDEDTAKTLAEETTMSGERNGKSLLTVEHGPQGVARIHKDAKAFVYLVTSDVTELEMHVKATGLLYKVALTTNARVWVLEQVKSLILSKMRSGATLSPGMATRLKDLVDSIKLAKEGHEVELPEWSTRSRMFANVAKTWNQMNEYAGELIVFMTRKKTSIKKQLETQEKNHIRKVEREARTRNGLALYTTAQVYVKFLRSRMNSMASSDANEKGLALEQYLWPWADDDGSFSTEVFNFIAKYEKYAELCQDAGMEPRQSCWYLLTQSLTGYNGTFQKIRGTDRNKTVGSEVRLFVKDLEKGGSWYDSDLDDEARVEKLRLAIARFDPKKDEAEEADGQKSVGGSKGVMNALNATTQGLNIPGQFGQQTGGGEGPKCWGCGESGHFKRDCTKHRQGGRGNGGRGPGRGGGGRGRGGGGRSQSRNPKQTPRSDSGNGSNLRGGINGEIVAGAKCNLCKRHGHADGYCPDNKDNMLRALAASVSDDQKKFGFTVEKDEQGNWTTYDFDEPEENQGSGDGAEQSEN